MLYLSLLLLGLVNFFLGFRFKVRNLLEFFVFHFLLICAQIIVLFELLSFFHLLNQPIWFLGFQGVFLFFAILTGWKHRSTLSATNATLKSSWQDLTSSLRKNKFFTFYALVILVIYLGIAAISMSFPQTTTDSLYNHLSRIGHWLQQGSLLPYSSFSEYAVTYPYNNSLLMMWSVLFLKDDILVGLTQWFSTFLLAASIFGLGIELNLPRKASAYAALIFLTFPIVALEAGTAQNDILAAAFFLCATWLTIIGLRQKSTPHMVFSGIAIGLAIGTKQYVLYALPGLLLLIVYLLRKEKLSNLWKTYQTWIISVALFTLLLGSYTYLQNYISFGNFFVKEKTNILAPTPVAKLPAKFAYNTSRLATQFISCDGLPVPWNQSCLSVKEKVFSGFFSALKLDLTSKAFMLEENCGGICFGYGTRYPFNEESAWFGPLSWILILLGTIISLINSIKKKNALPLILLLSAYFFFAVTAVFKTGWDAYLGRYLILSTAMVAPFMAFCLKENNIWQKLFTRFLIMISLFIALYTGLSNEAKPIITSTTLERAGIWAKQNNFVLATKVIYKTVPYVPSIRSITQYTTNEIKDSIDPRYPNYATLINRKTVQNDRLAIITKKQIFLDYYLFGDHFTQQIYEFPYEDNMDQILREIQALSLDSILISNDIAEKDPPMGFYELISNGTWAIFRRQ